ncbi:MAG: TIGR03905 family TSCPD domain-containing protein [Bacilli bacterium]|nr:TIGR03905 family TSCPD domain-containing protein [Bacilli bacterium]
MAVKVIQPQGVCSRQMNIEYDDNGVITACQIIGGCGGNTTGISHLVVGMKVEDVVKRLSGIPCRGSRTGQTSCPDQLAQGLKEIL